MKINIADHPNYLSWYMRNQPAGLAALLSVPMLMPAPQGKMRIAATFHHVKTGREAVCIEEYPAHFDANGKVHSSTRYYYLQGNMSNDWNRLAVLHEALGLPEPPEYDCMEVDTEWLDREEHTRLLKLECLDTGEVLFEFGPDTVSGEDNYER